MVLYTLSLLAAVLVAGTHATMAPSYPSPGTIWTAGKQYSILWADDGKSPGINQSWTSFKIDFMTGSNDNQTFLTNVATGLDASKISSYSWTAPNVDPYAAIYFFKFTSTTGQFAWTTRFGIVAKDGDALVAEPERTQPTGEAIPWGEGHLAAAPPSSALSSPPSAAAATPVAAPASSAAPVSGSEASQGSALNGRGTATEAAGSTAAAAPAADASSASSVSFSSRVALTAAGIFVASLLTFPM